ncbi:MAG: acetyl-CoA carboxylase biotin carboxyl carrier protein [Nitrospirota bacterium]|jgi:acetyl-CoA carboxylase biotin carboxyl carrier protein
MAKENPPESGLTSRDIRELIRMLSRTDVEELELERAGERVRLRRFSRGGGAVPPPVEAQVTPPAPAPNPPSAGPAAVREPVTESGQETITSPIVGTYYRAPAPEAPPFVQQGDTVKAGQTLCIIEAMKLMNEVEAERPCRIIRCLVEDATPVEYGEALFVVEPL